MGRMVVVARLVTQRFLFDSHFHKLPHLNFPIYEEAARTLTHTTHTHLPPCLVEAAVVVDHDHHIDHHVAVAVVGIDATVEAAAPATVAVAVVARHTAAIAAAAPPNMVAVAAAAAAGRRERQMM